MAEEEANKTGQEQSSSSSSSDSNPCPICLGPFVQLSYLDRCFHKFCYTCILRWTKVVTSKHPHAPSSVKCPLCKTENFSIIHGYDGSSFQQHYFNQDLGNSDFFSKAHKYRLRCYYIESGTVNEKFNVSRYWKFRKYLQQNQWLYSWLKREIQALVQEEDVNIIVHHILGMIDSLRRNEQKYPRSTPEAKQQEFKMLVSQAAGPFLAGRTDRFVNEVELFLASGLNIEAYDKVYLVHLGWKVHGLSDENEEEGCREQATLAPYMYFFDEDSDGID